MIIRKLTSIEDRVWASLSNNLAFGGRRSMEDIRKQVEENPSTHDDWGFFTDDGRMMAHVQNEHRLTMFDGHEVYTGCIGCVSTFPEYREGGAVRSIFTEQLFPDAYANGEVFSYLFPFKHAFYRKFGYETCGELPVYRFPVTALNGRHFTGWAKMWLPGDDVSEHAALYSEFAKKYNQAHVRTVEEMKGRIHSDPFESRRYTYLLGNDKPCAFVTFASRHENGRSTIDVQDCAWLGKEGMDAMLGFLARYTADYYDICIRMPSNIRLAYLIPDGKALNAGAHNVYMARLINTKKALEMLEKPAGACFTIEVSDALIPENAGTWRVDGDKVEKCDAEADISVSVTALAPMLLGYIGLEMAELRDDVKVNGNREVLEKVFVEKPHYLTPADHF